MAELARDGGDVHTFGAELGGMGVAEAVSVDALFDAGPRVKARASKTGKLRGRTVELVT